MSTTGNTAASAFTSADIPTGTGSASRRAPAPAPAPTTALPVLPTVGAPSTTVNVIPSATSSLAPSVGALGSTVAPHLATTLAPPQRPAPMDLAGTGTTVDPFPVKSALQKATTSTPSVFDELSWTARLREVLAVAAEWELEGAMTRSKGLRTEAIDYGKRCKKADIPLSVSLQELLICLKDFKTQPSECRKLLLRVFKTRDERVAVASGGAGGSVLQPPRSKAAPTSTAPLSRAARPQPVVTGKKPTPTSTSTIVRSSVKPTPSFPTKSKPSTPSLLGAKIVTAATVNAQDTSPVAGPSNASGLRRNPSRAASRPVAPTPKKRSTTARPRSLQDQIVSPVVKDKGKRKAVPSDSDHDDEEYRTDDGNESEDPWEAEERRQREKERRMIKQEPISEQVLADYFGPEGLKRFGKKVASDDEGDEDETVDIKPVRHSTAALDFDDRYAENGLNNPECDRCITLSLECIEMVDPRLSACKPCHTRKIKCSVAARKKAEKKAANIHYPRISRGRSVTTAPEANPKPPKPKRRTKADHKADMKKQGLGLGRKAKVTSMADSERIDELQEEVRKLMGLPQVVDGLKREVRKLRQETAELRAANGSLMAIVDRRALNALEAQAAFRADIHSHLHGSSGGGLYLGLPPDRSALTMAEHVLATSSAQSSAPPPAAPEIIVTAPSLPDIAAAPLTEPGASSQTSALAELTRGLISDVVSPAAPATVEREESVMALRGGNIQPAPPGMVGGSVVPAPAVDIAGEQEQAPSWRVLLQTPASPSAPPSPAPLPPCPLPSGGDIPSAPRSTNPAPLPLSTLPSGGEIPPAPLSANSEPLGSTLGPANQDTVNHEQQDKAQDEKMDIDDHRPPQDIAEAASKLAQQTREISPAPSPAPIDIPLRQLSPVVEVEEPTASGTLNPPPVEHAPDARRSRSPKPAPSSRKRSRSASVLSTRSSKRQRKLNPSP